MKRVRCGRLWGGVATLGVAAAAALLPAAAADAALLVDLRFDDGTKSKVALPGTYTVDIWAQVSGGTNGTNADEGLLSLHGAIESAQVNGGILSGGGVTGTSGFGPAFTTAAPTGRPGTPQNRTPDGVQDWGTTAATDLTNTPKYNSAVSAGIEPVFNTTPGATFNNLGPGSVEFKVGTFTVTIGATDVNPLGELNGGSTRFNWVKGIGNVAVVAHSHRVDNTLQTAGTSYLDSTLANAVTFTAVPEPAALGVLGTAAALGLLGRRRTR